jgi:DNA-binding CsgD family transcriptional regulator/tetratricopeptide (TPR) repeat protein
VGALSIEQISEKLSDSLQLLTRGGRTTVPRHQTLKGAMDWSYELLSQAERKLFGRLSMFAGGWNLEAAQAGGVSDGVSEGNVLDLLSGLVDKSLVVAETTGDGAVRYRMLEPIRQYAREKLEEDGEAEAVIRRHAEFFLALAEEGELGLWEPDQGRWLKRLELDHDNMRVALSWALEHKVESSLRLAGTLRRFWRARGNYGEGRRWLEEALAKDDGRASASARAKALEGLAHLAVEQGDFDRAEVATQEGLELSARAGVEGSLTASLHNILGDVVGTRGDYAQAKRLYEEGLRLYREAGDRRGIAMCISDLGKASMYLGDYEQAKELLQEGFALSRELGGAVPLGGVLINLGYAFLLEGDHERAMMLNEEAAALFRDQGQRDYLPVALDNAGWAALLRRDHERAETFFAESLALGEELGAKLTVSESLEGLACVAGAKGEAEWAARLFGAAWALREAVGYRQLPKERALREPYLADALSQLDEAAWNGALAQGRTMNMNQAVEYALSEEKSATRTYPEPGQPAVDAQPALLTRREKQIANLVAQGLSNRQIAQELVISERTVHAHIYRILKKLNLRSREQVASRLGNR